MADWKDKDPFAGGDSDDPFAGESPSVAFSEAAPEKPSLLRRGLSAVGGAIAEIPQIAYEGVAAVPNAMYRGDRKSTRLNSSHIQKSRMPSSA